MRTTAFSAILNFVPPPSAVRDHIRILGEFVRQPVHTGTVAPSSPWLAESLVENMGLAEAETVVELGPGTGPFTRLIAQRARPDAVVLALELNPRLAAELVGQFAQIEIVNDSAERLPDHLRSRGRTHADCILSGLPFAAFTQDLQRRLLDAILESLPTGGRFATFAYVHAAWLPPGQRFRRLLESRFSRVTRSSVVWRNLPPAFVYRCEK